MQTTLSVFSLPAVVQLGCIFLRHLLRDMVARRNTSQHGVNKQLSTDLRREMLEKYLIINNSMAGQKMASVLKLSINTKQEKLTASAKVSSSPQFFHQENLPITSWETNSSLGFLNQGSFLIRALHPFSDVFNFTQTRCWTAVTNTSAF